jgi:hypothetical protein
MATISPRAGQRRATASLLSRSWRPPSLSGGNLRALVAFLAVAAMQADQKKLTIDQRVEIMRGLTAEYATVKVALPRSKKALEFQSDGTWDKQAWIDAGRQFGPAGRVGDLVEVTHVEIEKDSIILTINNGSKVGSWKDHVQVGMAGPMGGTVQQVNTQDSNAPGGTTIALRFNAPIGELGSHDVKKILAPVLDFDKHTVTEQYTDTLPPEVKKAIEDKKPIEGMDRDQVLLALGRPVRKTRETKDGVEYEDWIYGNPPGRMTFVTFVGPKVVRVKDTYAGLGGTIAETPQQP